MTTPIGRAHLHLPIQDATGAVYSYAQVQFLQPGTLTPTTEPIYAQGTGGAAITQPLFCDPAVIDVWTNNAVRVDIVATVPGNVRVAIPGIDIRPDADLVANAPGRMTMSGSQNTSTSTILMSLDTQSASFQTVDIASTHQHQGDSAGSVVLTGEQATDFDPYQTWVGYHAGENPASNSTGSTALGPLAELNGTVATILGVGEVTTQTSTGVLGDQAVIVSGEDSNASQGTTTLGSANLLRQGTAMTVVGSLNGPSSPSAVPNGATVVGSGDVVGAAGEVKIGANHPTSTAGPAQVVIGNANIAQKTLLPWAGTEYPVALGQNITLAGDPSTNTSTDDWFGGVGPLAIGRNSTTWTPSLEMLQGNAATQALLRVTGDASVAGNPTWNNTSMTLGFYGSAGTTRPKINYNSTDVAHPLLTALMNDLAGQGLILTNTQPVVLMNGGYAVGSPLEFADTGQALQWSVPATSPTYMATNPFQVTTGGGISLATTAAQTLPTMRNRGVPALFGAGMQDQVVFGQFVFNPTGVTNLVSNPDFETNTSGWVNYDGDTISQSGTVARFNQKSLRIAPSGVNAWARAGYTVGSVTSGTVYNWSAWICPTSARQVMISADAYNGSTYNGAVGTTNYTVPANFWTRISTTVTAPSGSPTLIFNAGLASTTGNPSATEYCYLDGAQLTTGAALQPYVDSTGFHPDDQYTGIMAKSYLAKSVSGGNTIATPTGYLMSRTRVYQMSGLNVTSTVLTLPTPLNTGDIACISTSGTAVTFKVNGTTVGSMTDSVLTTRVKCGFRVAESTSCTYFSAYPQ